MDVVIVAQYLRDITNFKDNNSRFVCLSKLLAEKEDCNVEIITSDFHHTSKKSFLNVGEFPRVKVSVLHEPGYKKNISLQRFYSHWKLSKELCNYLKKRKKPDVIYCAIPSLDVAYVVAKYAKSSNLPLVVDVQDLWPEAFKMVFNIPIISNLLFYPMKKKADYVYKSASTLIAVSETYLKRTLLVNKKCKSYKTVFLGTELSKFDKFKEEYKKNKEDQWCYIGYVGTLSYSYNLKAIINAVDILNKKGFTEIKMIVMGDGPLAEHFKEYAVRKGVNAEFIGKLPYDEMVGTLCMCDIAVNPIVSGSAGSIINKVGDYAAAGIPVINTQECLEYRELLTAYNAGINCNNEDIEGIADAIEKLWLDDVLRKSMGGGNRVLAEELFDREKTYNDICELILREGFNSKS